jgi:hypothetical protein
MQAAHFHQLVARAPAAHENDVAPRETKRIGQRGHELVVRSAVRRGRRDTNGESTIAHSRNGARASAWRRVHLEAHSPVVCQDKAQRLSSHFRHL